MNDLTKKFEGHTWSIDIPDKGSFNSWNEAVEVVITTREDGKYSASFVTRKFIDYMFEKNGRTGECAKGTYFSMPNMIIVDNIGEENIRQTIADMIRNRDIENYFKKINNYP